MRTLSLCACLLLLLVACARGSQDAADPQGPAAVAAPAPTSPLPAPSGTALPATPALAPQPAGAGVGATASARALAQRAAQAYLDDARAGAAVRRDAAKAVCATGVPDYEVCIAAADEAYEGALRQARVEFDARMSAAAAEYPEQ